MSKLFENGTPLISPRTLIFYMGISAVIGILTPFSVMSFQEAVELMHEDWSLFTKLFIAVLGAACVLPLLYELMRYGVNKIEFFSPTIVFPLLYFAVFGLGSLRLIAQNDPRVFTILSYALAGIIFYYAGVRLMSLSLHFTQREKVISRVLAEWDPYLLRLLILSFVTISFWATIYHALKTGLPIFLPNLEETRVMIQREVTNYIIFLMRLVIPAFFFLLVYGLLHRGIKRITLIVFFVASLLTLLSLANRHDIFTFFICSLLIYNFAGKKLKLKTLIPIILIGFISLMLVGFYRLVTLSYITPEKAFLMEVAGPNLLLMFFAYSIFQFTNYPLNFAIYLDTFPNILPFEWGYSFVRALSTILPGHQDLLDEFVKSQLNLEFLGGGINPTLLGELYANFGYGGLLGMSLYGAIITFLYYKMLKTRSGISVILYSYGLSCLLLGLIGGFFSHFLYFYYMIIISFVYFIIRRKKRSILPCEKVDMVTDTRTLLGNALRHPR